MSNKAKRTNYEKWPELYQASRPNGDAYLRIAPDGTIHCIAEEFTLDGRRIGPNVFLDDIAGWSREDHERNRDRIAKTVTDFVMDPVDAAQFCVNDSIPESLRKYVHVHA